MAIAKSRSGTRGMRGAALAKLFARVAGPVMIRQHRKRETPSAATPCCT